MFFLHIDLLDRILPTYYYTKLFLWWRKNIIKSNQSESGGCWIFSLLDVRLVDGDERGVDGDGYGGQMEVVEKNGQVVV